MIFSDNYIKKKSVFHLGKILLDGHDLKSLRLKWLREQMGLVSQEPALFATTIASNIMLGKENADMGQVIEAARSANAHSFIQELPDGYFTQVPHILRHFQSASTDNDSDSDESFPFFFF